MSARAGVNANKNEHKRRNMRVRCIGSATWLTDTWHGGTTHGGCEEVVVPVPFRWHGELILEASGYVFYVRLYWRGFGFQANSVDECVLLRVLLHILVGLKQTWDQKLSSGLMCSQMNLAMTGSMLLKFMTTHLFQFRFADTEQYFLRPPPSLINWRLSWLITLTYFWTGDDHVRGARQKPSTRMSARSGRIPRYSVSTPWPCSCPWRTHKPLTRLFSPTLSCDLSRCRQWWSLRRKLKSRRLMPPITAWFRVGVPTNMTGVQASSALCSSLDWTCLTVWFITSVCASLPRCKRLPSRHVWDEMGDYSRYCFSGYEECSSSEY